MTFSGVLSAAPIASAQAPPVLQGAALRMIHGAGTFGQPLSLDINNPTTEPRQGSVRTIVFTFDKPVNAAAATVTEGTATASAPAFNGIDILVDLTGVTDQQYVTLSLANVASTDGGTGGTGVVRIGFLVGDVSQNRVVTVADLGLVNAQLAQPVTATNFLKDVNASGTLTLADKGTTNTKLTNALPVLLCDTGLPSGSSDPQQYAAAMDLCQTTTEAGTSPGLISAALTLTSGTGTPAATSRALRGSFGANTPQKGAAMVVLSTGAAAATGQTNPSFLAFQPGFNAGTSNPVPADWLAANGGIIPSAPGCPSAISTTAYDPVMLTLRIRVPDNANSFSIAAKFFAADFPEFVCSEFNDNFVALLDSAFAGNPPNPADKNLAVYTSPAMSRYPVGVNLATSGAGIFSQCVNGVTGCSSGNPGVINTCTGTAGLTGTGMDITAPGSCSANSLVGGGTDWFVIRGNVVPGEIIVLRLALWDTGDGTYDSVVLLDNFAWSSNTITPGTSSN